MSTRSEDSPACVRARHRANPCALSVLLVASWLTGTIPAAQGAEFNVADSDEAGLIQAINDANANAEPDVINLAPSGIYTLTAVDNMTDGANGLPSITSEITINGNGSIIRRSAGFVPEFRIFHVAAGGNLTLNDVSLRNGRALEGGSAAEKGGGAIFNAGTTTVIGSSLLQNHGGQGEFSTFSGGSGGDGGAIYNAGTMTVDRSTVSENMTGPGGFGDQFGGSGGNGGGIYNIGVLLLTHSTVLDNTAGEGGGSLMFPGSDGTGGGIYNSSGGDMTMIASTISQNGANTNAGGIYNLAQMVVTSTTITANTGFGARNNADLDVTHAIFADQASGADCDGNVAPFSLGHNLDSDGSCMLSGIGDISGGNAMLGSLADNGGPTETHLLMAGSDAIDAGDASASASDQRGYPRPFDGDGDSVSVSDIGAVELFDCDGDTVDDADPTDSDGDTVPDLCDACPGEDDSLDSDADGVVDCLDPCPNDAPDDSDGDGVCDSDDVCPGGDDSIDTDADGTPDDCDDCPDDPEKTAPGACDCGTPDTDTDGDGFADCVDLCPLDPNKSAPGACDCGNPDTDANGNGTPDCLDVPTTQPTTQPATGCIGGLLMMVPVTALGCAVMRRTHARTLGVSRRR